MSGKSELFPKRLEEVQAERESVRREKVAERAELEELRKGAAEQAAREAFEAAAKEAVNEGSEPPCRSQGCRYNRRSKATATTTVCPYSCRKTACEFQSSSMGKRCTCGRVDSKLS